MKKIPSLQPCRSHSYSPVLFQILNAAQNKLERLPSNLGPLVDGTVTLPRKGSRRDLPTSPMSVMEELYLQVREEIDSNIWIIE